MGTLGRSRKGAWIEIISKANSPVPLYRRSRKGAWIEIHLSCTWANVKPSLP